MDNDEFIEYTVHRERFVAECKLCGFTSTNWETMDLVSTRMNSHLDEHSIHTAITIEVGESGES